MQRPWLKAQTLWEINKNVKKIHLSLRVLRSEQMKSPFPLTVSNGNETSNRHFNGGVKEISASQSAVFSI